MSCLIIKRDDLTAEDRKYFADKMIEIANKTEEVADKIGLKDTESKEFKLKVLDLSLIHISTIIFRNIIWCQRIIFQVSKIIFNFF